MKNLLLSLSLLLAFGALAEDRHFFAEAPSIDPGAAQVDRSAQDSADVEDLEFYVPVYANGFSTNQGLSRRPHQTTAYFFKPRRSHAIRAPPVSRT